MRCYGGGPMRWSMLSLIVSLTANASSVLLVPQNSASQALADELSPSLASAGFTVKMAGPTSPAVKCLAAPKSRDACLTGIAAKAKVVGVLVVNGRWKGKKGTLTLELVANNSVLQKLTTAIVKGRVKPLMAAPLSRILKALPSAAPAPVPAVVAEPQPAPAPTPEKPAPELDAPQKSAVVLVPKAPREEIDLREEPVRAPKPKVAAWVVTALAVAAAGTAAAFGGLGFSNKAQLEKAPDGLSSLTYSEAVALQQTSNSQLTVALGSGIGAGVAGVVAGVLWGTE
jgi:hypothetical protein